jgi:hypothetical protein
MIEMICTFGSMLDSYRVQTVWYYILSFYHSFAPSWYVYIPFQISGRLFSDSGPRRSSRLSSDASVTSNANATIVSGNGTSNSYKGGSKLGPMTFRTMTIRKGQSWANENIDGGDNYLYISFLIISV